MAHISNDEQVKMAATYLKQAAQNFIDIKYKLPENLHHGINFSKICVNNIYLQIIMQLY